MSDLPKRPIIFKFISFAPRRVFRFGLLSSHGGEKTMEKEEQKPDAPSSTRDRFAKRNLAVSDKKFTLNAQKYNLSCLLLERC